MVQLLEMPKNVLAKGIFTLKFERAHLLQTKVKTVGRMEANIIEKTCFNCQVFSDKAIIKLISMHVKRICARERRDVLGISQNRRFGDVPLVCSKQEDISA